MRILVTGATGFIASQIVADLRFAGHEVVLAVRDLAYASHLFPDASLITCDFINDTQADIWLPRLSNIDVVINCVGILYHPDEKKIWAIHYQTPRALFDACLTTGVKKIIQISALGIEHSSLAYAKSKKAADEYLLSLPMKSIVLRPSLVYGKGSYGGTSLFRGLAGLPGFIPLPGQGNQAFQPIHIQDLSRAVQVLMLKDNQEKLFLQAVGPKQFFLRDILNVTRAWLGFSKAILIKVPLSLLRFVCRIADFIPRSTINTTSYQMTIQDNVCSEAETKQFFDAIGFLPRDFVTGLYSEPSTVQDHWHARLYFIKPLLPISIALVWIITAISTVSLGRREAYELLAASGISAFWQPILLYLSSALDAALGFAMLFQYQLRKVAIIQILVMLFYTLIISWKLPQLWLEPLAPIAKNIPLLVTLFVLLALESDR